MSSDSKPNDRTVLRDANAAEFLRHAGVLLYRDECVNTLMLGLSEGLLKAPSVLSDDPPWFLRVLDEAGATVAAAMRTPPANLIVSYADSFSLRALAENLWAAYPGLPGVVGPSVEANAFAELWCRFSGKTSEVNFDSRIYGAEQIKIPQSVEGEMRAVREDESDLALSWLKAFVAEAIPNEPERGEEVWQKTMVRFFALKSLCFWIYKGEPVCIANSGRPTANTETVNYVYTTKNFRRRGFAAALTAHLSQKILSYKKHCVLYADTDNPTTNKIYQEIGYRYLADSKSILFR